MVGSRVDGIAWRGNRREGEAGGNMAAGIVAEYAAL
jgi:hypothetical protein